MRSRALVLCALLALTFTAVVGGAAQASTSPRADLTALTIEGAKGSSVLPSGYVQYTGADVSVSDREDGLWFQAGTSHWSVTVQGPSDGPLTTGTFSTTRFPGPGSAGLDIDGDGRGCNESVGKLIVHELHRDKDSGLIDVFAATYSFTCNSVGPATVGELRYHSTVDYERLGSVRLGVNSPQHVTTVTATEDTTFGAAAIEGPDASSYLLGQDTCSGRVVSAGQTCTVGLLSHPLHQGGLAANLRLPAATGDRLVGLTTVGVDTPVGAYTAVPSHRILDTRRHIGVPGNSPLGSHGQTDVQVLGTQNIPRSGVSSVVVNVTVVNPSAPGYVTVCPSGVPLPTASTVNFAAHWTGADLVTVSVGTNGKIHLFNYAGSTHVVADVVGYYHSSTSTADPEVVPWSGYHSITPDRAIDTRTADWHSTPVRSNYWIWQALDFGEDNARIRAFAVNVTATRPTGTGYLVTYDGDSDIWPTSSTLNFTPGRTVPNMTIIPVGHCFDQCGSSTGIPRFAVGNASTGSVDVVADVVGIYYEGVEGDRGWRYRPFKAPTRFVDSRYKLGLKSNLTPYSSQVVESPTTIAQYNTQAIVSNITAARPSYGTHLTLYSNEKSTPPNASNLNPYAGQVVSNMAMTDVWTRNDFRIFNQAGITPFIMDAAGTMEHYPAVLEPPAAAALKAGSPSRPKPGASIPAPTLGGRGESLHTDVVLTTPRG